MFADILDVPVTVSQCSETGALRAAIAAGVAAGGFPTLEEGMARMVRIREQCVPRGGDGNLTKARYRLYGDLATTLPAHWSRYLGEVAAF
jgi:L-xylulokinase